MSGGLAEFLHMGGYAPYVWGAYGLTAVVLIANVVGPWRHGRRVREELAREARARQAQR